MGHGVDKADRGLSDELSAKSSSSFGSGAHSGRFGPWRCAHYTTDARSSTLFHLTTEVLSRTKRLERQGGLCNGACVPALARICRDPARRVLTPALVCSPILRQGKAASPDTMARRIRRLNGGTRNIPSASISPQRKGARRWYRLVGWPFRCGITLGMLITVTGRDAVHGDCFWEYAKSAPSDTKHPQQHKAHAKDALKPHHTTRRVSIKVGRYPKGEPTGS